MTVCDECLSLQERLDRANDQYVGLILQEERMMRDGCRNTGTFGVFEDALREVENVRTSVARMLVAHRGTHLDTPIEITTARRLKAVPVDSVRQSSALANLQKLAAIDPVFLGTKLILLEFGAGMLLSTALDVLVLGRGHPFWQVAFANYLICLGINFLPVLLCAVNVTIQRSAHVETAEELADKHKAMSKSRWQSLLLLVPLLVPILTLIKCERRND